MQDSLSNLLLFNKLDKFIRQKIVASMYERTVPAGEILIQQGDTGIAASQLFVVKAGKFEVGSGCSTGGSEHSKAWLSSCI